MPAPESADVFNLRLIELLRTSQLRALSYHVYLGFLLYVSFFDLPPS